MRRILILFCAAVLLCSFSACAASPQPAAQDMQILDITQWPENEYTRAIPTPDMGTPVTEIKSGSLYSVTLDGVSRQMCYDYLACLAQNGFQIKFPGQENDVSGGWLYSNGNAVVTVSQSGSRMIIGITFESID